MTKHYNSQKINDIITHALLERGFLMFNNDVKKLDLHFYFPEEPARIGYKDDEAVLEVKLLLYSGNHESFIRYKYIATFTNDFSGFRVRNPFEERYSYIISVFARIINEYGVMEAVKEELMEV